MRHVVRKCRNDGTEYPFFHTAPCEVDFAEDWEFLCRLHHCIAEERGCPQCAYAWAGHRWFHPSEIAAAFEARWVEASAVVSGDSLHHWCQDALGDHKLAGVLREIANDAELRGLDDQIRLAATLLALSPARPLTWRGQPLTADWLREHPVDAWPILDSNLGRWVDRLRSDAWLSLFHERWAHLRKRARKFEASIDFSALARWFLATAQEARAEAARIRAEFCAASDLALDRFIQAAALDECETIVLAACTPSRLRSRREVWAEKTAALRRDLAMLLAEAQRSPTTRTALEFGARRVAEFALAHAAEAEAIKSALFEPVLDPDVLATISSCLEVFERRLAQHARLRQLRAG